MKRFAALILSMAMAVSSLPAMAMAEEHNDINPVEREQETEETEVSDDITVFADAADVSTDVTFTNRYWDADQKQVISKDKTITFSQYVVLKDVIGGTSYDGDVQTDAMYLLVTEDITINGKLIIKSDHSGTDANVGLIIYDGVTLRCNEGIVCEGDNVLNIYGVSPNPVLNGYIVTTGKECAGIGGRMGKNTGTINLYGCQITATGDEECAGIGGGSAHSGGTINIYAGYIKATGGNWAAGIGGGSNDGNGGIINIYGGSITAFGGEKGAGIGGGNGGNGGNITTYVPGNVWAKGGKYGAGIGGGYHGAGGSITINGGTFTAEGGANGAGIGGGDGRNGGTITINGGSVNSSSRDGAGIGGGDWANGGNIKITGGHVDAFTFGGGAGIGSGNNSSFEGTIEISGGTVEASAYVIEGCHGAAIGAGDGGSFSKDGTIKFLGGNTTCELNSADGPLYGIVCGPGTDLSGDPKDCDGTFEFGKYMTVLGGSVYANVEERENWIKAEHKKVQIEPCDHYFNDASYSLDSSHPGQHKRVCVCCYYTDYQDHTYIDPTWEWTGFSSAQISLTCKNCYDIITVTATGNDITSKVTKKATYVNHGERVYTAAVTVAGKEYTDTKKEVLPLRTDTYEIKYKDTDGSTKTATARQICGDETTLGTGWYAVTESVVNNNRIICNGDVNLILCDDTEFKAPSGINVPDVPDASSLTIWGQTEDSGVLTAGTGNKNFIAAIGGNAYQGTGLITINGGTIVARSICDAAGIGSAENGQGTVVINGGKITATCDQYGAGIGGGLNGKGVVTINGGIVTARGGYMAAGIGCGTNKGQGSVVINGGVVNAIGGNEGNYHCGIGSGYRDNAYSEEEMSKVTLNYGENGVYITSNGYYGVDVTLAKKFTDGTQTYEAGSVADATTLENKTLRAPALVAGYTVSLDGTIGVNYHMDLTSIIAGLPGTAYMEFSVGSAAPQKAYLKDATTAVIGGKTYYVFRCEVPAKDMTTSISARFVDGDVVIPVNPFTVKEYADYLLDPANAHPDYEKSKDLVRALINYGAYSQEYFGVNPDSPANEGYKYSESEMNVTIPVEYKGYDKSFPDSMVTFAGSSLSLKSETTLSFYFKSSETLSFTCEDETKTVETVNSGVYQIARVRGITASELGRELRLDIKINGTSGSYIEYHPLTYCYKILNGGSDDVKLQNVCKAMYLYYKAAVDYMN